MQKKINKTPVPRYLLVKKAHNSHGNTIFAAKSIAKGKVMCTTDMTNMNYHDGCIMSPVGDVFLHSEHPNSIIRVNPTNILKIDIIASRDIESGEEILVNYPNTRHQTLTRNELIKILSKKGESIPGTKYE
jgi:hypothetical protein